MLVEGSQCAAYVTEFGSQSVNIALYVVQGVTSFLSIIGSVLLILSYVMLKPLRTKSRLLIAHLAAANFLNAFPSFLAVFMNFSAKFVVPSVAVNFVNQSNITELGQELSCSGSVQSFDHSASTYCNLCVYLGLVNLIGFIANIFWTVCVCIHFFILVSYRNTRLASRVAYAYYAVAWLAPLGISLWLLFHNWVGFNPAYSTVNCGVRAYCVPHHHPYNYQNTSYANNNWNRSIGVLFGIKIWQASVFIIIPCLFIAMQCRNRKQVSYIILHASIYTYIYIHTHTYIYIHTYTYSYSFICR